jgi:hypothetical protein
MLHSGFQISDFRFQNYLVIGGFEIVSAHRSLPGAKSEILNQTINLKAEI